MKGERTIGKIAIKRKLGVRGSNESVIEATKNRMEEMVSQKEKIVRGLKKRTFEKTRKRKKRKERKDGRGKE